MPTVGAKSLMERALTEQCMRQRTQMRAGLEAAPISKKKDRTVSNHAILFP